MYGKIFESMYDGTIAENWKALVTFQQMIILCDSGGVIDMTPQSISRRTGIPLEIITEGVSALEMPDPMSRTPDEEGRRIVRIDAHRPWGWRLVNHRRYRQIASSEDKRRADRERIADKRSTESSVSHDVAECSMESQTIADVAHTDTDTDTKETTIPADGGGDYSKEFSEFWLAYPRKVGKGDAWKKWKAKVKPAKQILPKILEALDWQKDSPNWTKDGGQFIPHPATYINQTRWLDEKQPNCAAEPEYKRKLRNQKSLEEQCN